MKLRQLLLLFFLLYGVTDSDAARFAVTGPVLTVTLKDPESQTQTMGGVGIAGDEVEEKEGSRNNNNNNNKWLDIARFRPHLIWSIQSQGSSKPLPRWLPSLQSIRGTVGYSYEQNKHLPSFVEGDAKFSKAGYNVEVQPTYDLKSHRSQWLIQASRGATYVMAKLSSAGDRWLDVIKGCYQANLPYASVGGIRITPQYDVVKREASCLLEGTTGSQRTKAVLNLEYQNPTLSVVHALDERYVGRSKNLQ